MASVRIWEKTQIRLDRLDFKQYQMFKVGNVGVVAVKNRVSAALGPSDAPAKPLTKRYAIRKTRLGKRNRWNLTLTGDMLRNFMDRTVSENHTRAGLSTRKNRIEAWVNQKIEPWVVFSPKNRAAVLKAAQQVLNEMKRTLLLERGLGGGQR